MKNKIKNMFSKVVKSVMGCVLLTAVLSLWSVTSQAAVFTTNITSAGGNFILLTNACRISQIQIIGITNLVLVDFFDSKTSSTNYTNASYVSTTTYATNITTTNISPLNNYTNFTTNIGVYTLTVTNSAGTNPAPYYTFAAPAATIATYPVNFINNRGVLVRVSTNATISLTYRTPIN